MNQTSAFHSLDPWLRFVMEQSHVPTLVTRFADDAILFVNRALLRKHGWERPHVIGKKSQDTGLWTRRAIGAAGTERLDAAGHAQALGDRRGQTDDRPSGAMTLTENIEIDGEHCLLMLIHDSTESSQAREEMRVYRLVLEASKSATRSQDEIFNRARLDDLAQVTSAAWLSEFVEACLEDVTVNVDRLISATKDRDAAAVRHIAHRLAGTTASIGAVRFTWICHQIEEAAREERFVCEEAIHRALSVFEKGLKAELARCSGDKRS